jgi:hypothetical protein
MSSESIREYPPERIGNTTSWRVFGPEGAASVLETFDYEAWLKEHRHARIKLVFSNRPKTRLASDHPLVAALAEIARYYEVVVTQDLGLPFTLDPDSLTDFTPSQVEIYNKA